MKNRYRKRIFGIILTLMIITLQMIPAMAEEIKPGRVVRVACGMNDCLYLDEAGNPAGICLNYLRVLGWSNNWEIEYVEGSYSEGIQNLYDGKVDLMFPVGKDDDTEGKLAFADYIAGYQQIGLFAKEDADIYYNDYEGFNHKKVGLSIGANSIILDQVGKEHGFTYTPVQLNTIQDKIDALMNGQVDMIAFSTLNPVPGGKLVAVLDQVPFYICTSTDQPDLLEEINFGMRDAMITNADLVSEMYQSVMKGCSPISMTKEEHNKIQNTDKVTFGVYSDCLPLAGVDSKGRCIGIYVDFLKEIAEESGLNIEIKPVADGNRLYSYMDEGDVDFVIGILDLRFSSENAENHLASNKIADYTTVAVTMPNYQFDTDSVPEIALNSARKYLEEYIYTDFPNAKITYYDTRQECLNAVRNGKADATFLNTWEYNYISKNPRYQDLMEWESIRIGSSVNLGGTRQSDLEILSILEKTIGQIPAERVADIIAKNMNMPYDSYDFADKVYQVKDQLAAATALFVAMLACFGVYVHVKKKYIKDLVVANKTKSDFLSRMSHEMRTPLNAIKGYASLTTDQIQKGDIDKEMLSENMGSIQKASEYLLGIINDILDVQRMETGRIVLNKSDVDPTEYMHTVVKMIQPMADEKHINFTYTMINGADYYYQLDELRVQQVLFKLLYNAVKFTPEGGSVNMSSEIQVDDKNAAAIRFVVEDTGIGMSREFMKTRLFHKFAQENQDITSPYSGCGNGLAICKELVELMGGTIECTSKQGEGTTFTVTLNTECRKKERRRREHRPAMNYDLSGIRVLMCEDNPMNQDMEKHLLERMKCEVEIADDGKIGLDKFAGSEEGYYSIVLMDIRMPNMDGLEATRAMRALDRKDAKTIPIVAVSANAFEEDIQMSLDAGMNEHLAKPVDTRVLYEKILQYCRPQSGNTENSRQ